MTMTPTTSNDDFEPTHLESAGWNSTPTDFDELRARLTDPDCDRWIADVDEKPGGAYDAIRIHLAQSFGTIPEDVALAIYDCDLEIHTTSSSTIGVMRSRHEGGQ